VLAKHKKREPIAGKVKYQPTAHEQSAISRLRAVVAAETPTPRITVPKGEERKIELDHPDKGVGYALLMDALGTADFDFGIGLINQLANAGSSGAQIDETKTNFLLSIVKGIKPKDPLEAMLAVQMAIVHLATMKFARQLNQVETIQQQDSAERTFNKLARTYTTQMEALKRYRTGGEQKVTVQHVSVNEGGQAIVGNVTQAAGKTAPQQPANSAPALTDAQKPAMTIIGKQEPAPTAISRKKKDDGRSST
jgi:hypothetical protein